MTPFLLILNVLLFFSVMLFLYKTLLGILRRIVSAENVLDTVFVLKMIKSLSFVLGVYSIRLIYLFKDDLMGFINEWLFMVVYADVGLIGALLVISYFYVKKVFI